MERSKSGPELFARSTKTRVNGVDVCYEELGDLRRRHPLELRKHERVTLVLVQVIEQPLQETQRFPPLDLLFWSNSLCVRDGVSLLGVTEALAPIGAAVLGGDAFQDGIQPGAKGGMPLELRESPVNHQKHVLCRIAQALFPHTVMTQVSPDERKLLRVHLLEIELEPSSAWFGWVRRHGADEVLDDHQTTAMAGAVDFRDQGQRIPAPTRPDTTAGVCTSPSCSSANVGLESGSTKASSVSKMA